ncbi:hypothetical protein PsorP6_014110 [Peronosclerospora sorghi]|uniref:Uncharacterized protein n=1 Tax=Peronosclerospora sorghi TaxID=230839 RepID=A0ACC0VHV1_9STRA|nr:hypothetical protein PsorP6_014110 [Peronosclerospora sorghi]
MLRDGVCQFGGKNWKAIAGRIEHRSPAECSKRWNALQGLDTVVKRPWSAEEDTEMRHLVAKYGASKWSVIASYLKDRNGKQCRERWHNQLNPSIKKTPWTEEENAIILRLQAQYGNCWAKITAALPGRTDNSVKNHWHSSLKSLGKARGSDTCSRDSAKSKRCKTRKKPRKARSVKKEEGLLSRTGAAFAFTDTVVAHDQNSACGVDGIAVAAVQAAACSLSLGEAPLASIDSFAGSSAGSVPCSVFGDGRGALSPDAVSSVDTFDLCLHSCTQSYQSELMKAQAVIDNVLDPMGIGGYNSNRVPPPFDPTSLGSDTIYDPSFQRSMARWYANDDNLCRSAGIELLPDPTSPAQPPFGLDELLFDPLQDVCGVMQSNPGSVQTAPPIEVAQALPQTMAETSLATCNSYPVMTPDVTPTSMSPRSMSQLDQIDCALFLKDFQIDAVHYEISPSECTMGPESTTSELSSLFEMDL